MKEIKLYDIRDHAEQKQEARADWPMGRATLPTSLSALLDLFDFLRSTLQLDGGPVTTGIHCNHTLLHMHSYARQHCLDLGPLVEWVTTHGGRCDCAVLLNISENYPFDGLADMLANEITMELESRECSPETISRLVCARHEDVAAI